MSSNPKYAVRPVYPRTDKKSSAIAPGGGTTFVTCEVIAYSHHPAF